LRKEGAFVRLPNKSKPKKVQCEPSELIPFPLVPLGFLGGVPSH
jgi:hypothetical protein